MTPLLQAALGAYAGHVARGIDLEVAHSMQTAYALALGVARAPTEPDFVAMLVTQAAPGFVGTLRPVLQAHGIALRLTAVFCHGRPEVQHGSRRCELGDVLFAHFHTDAAGSTYRNSLLLQAKMSSSAIHTVGASDLHQLGLYTQWGRITYRRSTGLSGQTRDVTPNAAHPGAQYLLIDDRGPADPNSGVTGKPGTYPMGTAIAQRHLLIRASLGHTLVHLMCGSDGRVFADRPAALADWDRVVWDLLDFGVAARFNQRRVGITGQPRGVDVVLNVALDNSLSMIGDGMPGGGVGAELGIAASDAGEPPSRRDRPVDDNEPGGVSLLIIETRESEGGERSRG